LVCLFFCFVFFSYEGCIVWAEWETFFCPWVSSFLLFFIFFLKQMRFLIWFQIYVRHFVFGHELVIECSSSIVVRHFLLLLFFFFLFFFWFSGILEGAGITFVFVFFFLVFSYTGRSRPSLFGLFFLFFSFFVIFYLKFFIYTLVTCLH
jgi:hypothetical protein